MRRALRTLGASALLHAILPLSFSFEVTSAVKRTLVPVQLETAIVTSSDAAASDTTGAPAATVADAGSESSTTSVAVGAALGPSPAALAQISASTSPNRNDGHEAALRAQRTAYLKNLRERVAAHRHYPYQARRAGIEGTVCLKLRLDAAGRLIALASTCGAPTPALLDAARAAAPFGPLPALLGADLAAELPVVFRLDQPAFHQ